MIPAQTLMGAYHRRRGEDRVTEVFATTLEQVPELLHGVAELAGLPRATTHRVRTQERHEGVIIDLEVAGLGDGGVPAWVLWSEHKVGDVLTAGQLRAEAAALRRRARGARFRLLAITHAKPDRAVEELAQREGWKLLRWQEVVSLASRITSAKSAVEALPTHALSSHFLGEWLDFARNELEVPIEPLTEERVRLLPEIDSVLATVDHFARVCLERGCPAVGADDVQEMATWYEAVPPEGSWLADREFKLFAELADDGYGPVSGPCLIVGCWLEGEAAAVARSTREFHTPLAERGFSIDGHDDRHGGWLTWAIPVALEEVAAQDSLEQQEDVVARAGEAALKALDPPLP